MGEYSAYYIPLEQENFHGREAQVADKFWKLGIFLNTSNGEILARHKSMRWIKFLIPKTHHKFSYGGMGLHDGEEEIAPVYVHDVKCPSCNTDISDDFHDVTENQDDNSPYSLIDLPITCPACGVTTKLSEVIVAEPGFCVAKFYLYVSDINPDDDWESDFKKTVESVLGPCKEIIAWDT